MKSPYSAYASNLTSPEQQTPMQVKPLFPSSVRKPRSPYSGDNGDYVNLGASTAYSRATSSLQSPNKSNAPSLPAYDHSPFMQQSIRGAMETIENVHKIDAAESDDLEQRLTGITNVLS